MKKSTKKWLIQKGIGLILIAISIALIMMARGQTSVEESDIGAVFYTAPLGLLCLFSKKNFIA